MAGRVRHIALRMANSWPKVEIGALAVFTFVRRHLAAAETALAKSSSDQLVRTVAKDREWMENLDRLTRKDGRQLRP